MKKIDCLVSIVSFTSSVALSLGNVNASDAPQVTLLSNATTTGVWNAPANHAHEKYTLPIATTSDDTRSHPAHVKKLKEKYQFTSKKRS